MIAMRSVPSTSRGWTSDRMRSGSRSPCRRVAGSLTSRETSSAERGVASLDYTHGPDRQGGLRRRIGRTLTLTGPISSGPVGDVHISRRDYGYDTIRAGSCGRGDRTVDLTVAERGRGEVRPPRCRTRRPDGCGTPHPERGESRRALALHRGRAGGEPPRGPAGRKSDGGRARSCPGGLPDRAVYRPLRHSVARPALDCALDVHPDLRHCYDPQGHLCEPGSDRGDPPGGALRLPADRPVRGVRLHPHRPHAPGFVPGVARAGRRLGGRAVEGDRVHAAVRLQLCDAVRVELRGGRPGDRVRPERRVAGGDDGADLPGGRGRSTRRPARDTSATRDRRRLTKRTGTKRTGTATEATTGGIR